MITRILLFCWVLSQPTNTHIIIKLNCSLLSVKNACKEIFVIVKTKVIISAPTKVNIKMIKEHCYLSYSFQPCLENRSNQLL